jgi:Cytochrome P460
MRQIAFVLIALATVAGVVAYTALAAEQPAQEAAPLFVDKIPPGYRDWRLISVAHEEGDLNDLRAVLGNDLAIKAYREGKPFPEGTIIARLAWSYDPSEETTRPLAVPNPSWPDPPRTGFSSWSRTRESTPRPAVGDTVISRTASLRTWRSTHRRARAGAPFER